MKLSDDLFLHYDEDLLVTKVANGLVLGRMLREGDGRYAIIKDGSIQLDASASLGLHYFLAGDVICSSSPILLQKFTGCNIRVPQPSSPLTWVAAPSSPAYGARRLLCDQALNLSDRQLSVAKRDRSGPMSVEAAAKLLAEESEKSAHALHALGKPIYVALTAGQDSRTIFAALLKAQVPFKAFTMCLDNGASRMDLRVAASICSKFDIEHVTVDGRSKGSKDRIFRYLEHSGGIDGDRGRQYAAGDFYRVIPDDAIVLHGGSLGLSKPHYEHVFEGEEDYSIETVIPKLERVFGKLHEADKVSIGEWLAYRSENRIGSIGDHFFIDQRRGTWGADNRFAEDTFAFEWFIFANSWMLIDSFWSVTHDERAGLMVQKRAIDILVPNLNEAVPEVNPGMTWAEKMRGRFSKRGAEKIRRRMRQYFM
jgi:hypothetical protein